MHKALIFGGCKRIKSVFNDVERSFIKVRIYMHSYFIDWAFLEYKLITGVVSKF